MTDFRIEVGLVQINVTDLERAWTFYTEQLGIPGRWILGERKAFELQIGPPTVLVYPVAEQRIPRYGEETGVTLVLHTSDIEATVDRWREADVEFLSIPWSARSDGIAETPFGPFIAFRDPFDNVHEVLEPHSGIVVSNLGE